MFLGGDDGFVHEVVMDAVEDVGAAMRGAGEEALAELDAALADPDLPPDQLDFARSARGRVELKVRPAALPQPPPAVDLKTEDTRPQK